MMSLNSREDALRVIATADLHYNIQRSRGPTEELAKKLVATSADVLILAGDSAGIDTRALAECLALFERFPGQKLLVPGNHCIWANAGQSSWDKYESILPRVAAEHGFDFLDQQPIIQEDVAFVGNMGWYDYSYRDESLAIPQRFYEHKVAPGAAARLPQHQHLLSGYSDVSAEAASIVVRWMDGHWVRWTFSDAQVTTMLADRFAKHLEWAAQRARTIVAVTHHLPFAGMLPKPTRPAWRFANAFMGSELFGQAMLGQEKCRLAICGHSHCVDELTIEHVRCVNVGSTYRHKRFASFDV